MTHIRKNLLAVLLGLIAVPVLAAGNQKNAETDCSWIKTLKVTNTALLGHMNKVMARDYSCFSTGTMKGMSSENMDVVFDFSTNDATVMLENGKKIITLPLKGDGAANAVGSTRWLIMLGGGGEPKNKPGTPFDPALGTLDSYLRGNEWRSVISFNGSNPQTEYIVSKGFPDAINKSSFTPNNYRAIIRNFEAQMKSGELKAGDQMLIMLASLGAMKTRGELTHPIAIGEAAEDINRNDLAGVVTASMDAFKDLAALAKEKKVKLAIVDFSSHSGNTLALANERACVISASGPRHFSSSAFAENMIQGMKAGKTLEDVFLEARKNTRDAAFPMISSPEGQSLSRDLYPGITPYLYQYDSNPARDKLAVYLVDAASDAGYSARENEYAEMQKKLDVFQAAPNKGNAADVAALKTLLAEYKLKQDQYINLARSLKLGELGRREKFEGAAEVGRKSHQMQLEISWKEILETDSDQIIRNVTSAKYSTNDAATQAQFQASINMYSKVRAKREEILEMYPSLANDEKKFQPQLKELEGSRSLAKRIAAEEKPVYDSMYRSLRAKQPQNNPCRDFVF